MVLSKSEIISFSYQGSLTKDPAPTYQVPYGHVEICAATAPVGDFSERVNCQDLLQFKIKINATCKFY